MELALGCLRGARSEVVISPHCFSFSDTRNSSVFQIIKAYLCPNIIDSVDFSERRPEEVISFF